MVNKAVLVQQVVKIKNEINQRGCAIVAGTIIETGL